MASPQNTRSSGNIYLIIMPCRRHGHAAMRIRPAYVTLRCRGQIFFTVMKQNEINLSYKGGMLKISPRTCNIESKKMILYTTLKALFAR